MSHPFVPFTVGDLKYALGQLPDDLHLICFTDDGSYQFVKHLPSILHYREEGSYLEIVDEDDESGNKNKAVCIN